MNTTLVHPSYWRKEKRDIKNNPINNNCLHHVMIRTAKGARRTYFRNNNENCNKQSVWQMMLFSTRLRRLQRGLWSEVGWGWMVVGSGELKPFGGLARWDYVLFLSSFPATCLPKLPCPQQARLVTSQTRHGPHTDTEVEDTLLRKG